MTQLETDTESDIELHGQSKCHAEREEGLGLSSDL